MTHLYPDTTYPYYVVTPSYEPASAGIRALHLLCHTLNMRGQTSYIMQDPEGIKRGDRFSSGPDLLTPYLTAEILKYHESSARKPIVIYPETICGNPYNASCVIRFVLNFPGLLAGDMIYNKNELIFAYSSALALSCDAGPNILFIPTVNTSIFKSPTNKTIRNGTCFYADKYRKVHKGVLSNITSNSVEITRHEPGSQTPSEIAALFQRSELFYTYENTALAIEAVLCGCPAVFIPNPFLDRIIGSVELGSDGYAWGDDAEEISRAKTTVPQGAQKYLSTIDKFWTQLDLFIASTKEYAEACVNNNYLEVRLPQIVRYKSLLEAACLETTRRLPFKLEREIARTANTIGLKRIGAALWNNSSSRLINPRSSVEVVELRTIIKRTR